jgi:hypothetical protein
VEGAQMPLVAAEMIFASATSDRGATSGTGSQAAD